MQRPRSPEATGISRYPRDFWNLSGGLERSDSNLKTTDAARPVDRRAARIRSRKDTGPKRTSLAVWSVATGIIDQASGTNRGLVKGSNFFWTGCFPPKPPARSVLTQPDDRRQARERQEYVGNQGIAGIARDVPTSLESAPFTAISRDCGDYGDYGDPKTCIFRHLFSKLLAHGRKHI